MALKVRKQIYIEPEQDRALKRISREIGVSEAEIIRAAIDRHAQETRIFKRDLKAWQAELEYIRKRASKGELPGERSWTREELYDR